MAPSLGVAVVSLVDAAFLNSGAPKRWRQELRTAVWGGPAVANGVLYVATQDGEVQALDAQSGQQRWKTQLRAGAGGGLSLSCGTLSVGYGLHDFWSDAEPLMGGMHAYTLTGTLSSQPACTTGQR